MRRTLPLILVAVVFSLPISPLALAGPQVPDVSAGDLPVAGTCAPLPQRGVTWVTVGELGWFRLDQDPRDIRTPDLRKTLMDRSRRAAEKGEKHDVWMVVSKRRTWAHVDQVRQVCQETGIFRVGMQVRAESGEMGMGLPLFLPAPAAAAPGSQRQTAYLLEVRTETPLRGAQGPAKPSNPKRLFAAAQQAVARTRLVVAELSMAPNTPVQEAVQAIDYLYRAGCAAVKLRHRIYIPSVSAQPVIQLWVGDQLLPPETIEVPIPPTRPRKMPWPDHGAGQPGSEAFLIEPIPSGRRPKDAPRRILPLPHYAKSGQGVPPQAMKTSGDAVRDWSLRLSAALKAVLRVEGPAFSTPLLVKRKRQNMGVDQFFREARGAFRGPGRVAVATARVQAYLFRQSEIVGQVDLTFSTAGSQLGIVFGSWIADDYPAELVLPPRETDRFSGGVPGHLRVWTEGILATARARGPAGVPLATEQEVLAHLPPVAHAGVKSALAGRMAAVENLSQWLRATPYDRVVILASEGTAAVHDQGRIAGILRFGLDAEEGELALTSIQPRVAPR